MRSLRRAEHLGAAEPLRGALTLNVPAEELATERSLPLGTIKPIDGGSCEFRTGDDDLDWLAMRVAMSVWTSRSTSRRS